MKLIAGKMNVKVIKCKAGYADGVTKPKRVFKQKLFNPIVILRKQEFKAA